ncbi:universal stress protein [Sphingomonas echinoides]|jgi:nucleotide-binding universal stress UspA family protein|uniref:Universal stress protein n=1 Tax=Sphingomonas echinoides TaxID=59803 RepID=A0ABU4PUP3_9SPHN|nr:universal stress protein [Sphingomonas echinoides]MDX5986579.1 universal stress protein [Sphingomonas echinoides]
MIKDLLAVIDDADRAQSFLNSVVTLSQSHDAVLEVAALTPAPMAMPAMAPFGELYVPEWVLMGDDAANVERTRSHLAAAGSTADVFGLHNEVGWLAGDLKRSRQVADLIVLGARETWTTPWLRRRVAETLIRASGTPLLLLPEGQNLAPVRKAILGWKPGPEATRAMHVLAHLAQPGATIDVITVGTTLGSCEKEKDSHAEVKRHLTRHGFAAEGHWIVNDERIEADTLTLYAQETQADLLVIGGFAHSRIRDIILGGTTRDLIERQDLPVLIVG